MIQHLWVEEKLVLYQHSSDTTRYILQRPTQICTHIYTIPKPSVKKMVITIIFLQQENVCMLLEVKKNACLENYLLQIFCFVQILTATKRDSYQILSPVATPCIQVCCIETCIQMLHSKCGFASKCCNPSMALPPSCCLALPFIASVDGTHNQGWKVCVRCPNSAAAFCDLGEAAL